MDMKTNEDVFYTPKEAAEKIKIHERSLRRLIQSGRLNATNFGTKNMPRWRIHETDIWNFMAEQKNELRFSRI